MGASVGGRELKRALWGDHLHMPAVVVVMVVVVLCLCVVRGARRCTILCGESCLSCGCGLCLCRGGCGDAYDSPSALLLCGVPVLGAGGQRMLCAMMSV